ncbi:MAG: hypothetical protein HUK23_04165 [Sphaerochaetaceae bacterium]|nr:hypothetical protein [Sphaerochaetaceae bacterium]
MQCFFFAKKAAKINPKIRQVVELAMNHQCLAIFKMVSSRDTKAKNNAPTNSLLELSSFVALSFLSEKTIETEILKLSIATSLPLPMKKSIYEHKKEIIIFLIILLVKRYKNWL